MKTRIPSSLEGKAISLTVRVCTECGCSFAAPSSLASRYATCSRECMSRKRSAVKVELTCQWCDTTFEVLPGHNRRNRSYCGNVCRLSALNAIERYSRNPSLNARQLSHTGYVRVWNGSRLVMEHRYVMATVIGRPLTPVERVHHINGIRHDNRPENLKLYASQAEHMREAHPDLVRNLRQ